MINSLLATEEITVAIVVVVVILLLLAISGIRIVPQAHEYVIERLGKYKMTLGAGFQWIIPVIDRVAKKVVLMEQVLDSDPQPVITKDNVTVSVDSVVYFKVFDSNKYTYGVVNPMLALATLTATTLRNIIGSLSLDESLTSRDKINVDMALILDKATDDWGMKVTRVEIKNIMPPPDIRDAMEKLLKADRNKQATILEAEAHQKSVEARAQGDKAAMVLRAEGERDAQIARAEGEAKALLLKQQAEADALRALKAAAPTSEVLELRRFEAMVKVADGKASKILIPTDMTTLVKNAVTLNETTGIGSVTEQAKSEPVKPENDPCCK